MLTKRHFQQALDSQSTCNLSGIVNSLNETMTHIWEEARANGHGTEWVNKHPICRLYAEQISFLAGSDTDSYMKASNDIEEIMTQWRD